MKNRVYLLLCFCLLVLGSTTAQTLNQFPGTESNWEGYKRHYFKFQDRDVIVVEPAVTASGNPWIWRPAFFGAFPYVDKALLGDGFHVAYYDLTHLYGSPRAVKLGTDFYHYMCDTFGLSKKVTVEGLSRGGLFALQWGAANPEKVACLYVDAPVCDLRSWPGRANKELWEGFLTEWGIQDSDVDDSFRGNVLNILPSLAKGNVPIMAVCGDSDKTVPYNDNMKKVRDAYQAMGGVVEVIVKPGCDHHPHSLEKPEPIVDFILRYQDGAGEKRHIFKRANSLQNAFARFTNERKGCVAFLGGSITEMKGWRDMMKEDLQQRFPYTEFTFIDAGISSTGSTPHSFRFENDVLKKGTPDLLFVEAAVNDATNGFTPTEQVRGMEGIVRHALRANPNMDIVMMHFAFDPFLAPLQEGCQPDVILNHERVANHYGISSINLAEEIAERIGAGEFTWEKFGGVHPAWFGHKFYVASINTLLDANSKPSNALSIKPHILPQPLDTFNYENGSFMNIKEATRLKGFHYEDSWSPADKTVGTRNGFVNVPMLVADKEASSLELDFDGRAIGIFCVAGPKAATLEYSIDGEPYKRINTYTEWSKGLYLPWVYMLGTELNEGHHKLKLRVAKGEKTECQIRNFVVNK